MGVIPINPDKVKNFKVHLMLDLLEQYGWEYVFITKFYTSYHNFSDSGFRLFPKSRSYLFCSITVNLYVDIPLDSPIVIIITDINNKLDKFEVNLSDPNSIQMIEKILGDLFPKFWWIRLKWRSFKNWLMRQK